VTVTQTNEMAEMDVGMDTTRTNREMKQRTKCMQGGWKTSEAYT